MLYTHSHKHLNHCPNRIVERAPRFQLTAHTNTFWRNYSHNINTGYHSTHTLASVRRMHVILLCPYARNAPQACCMLACNMRANMVKLNWEKKKRVAVARTKQTAVIAQSVCEKHLSRPPTRMCARMSDEICVHNAQRMHLHASNASFTLHTYSSIL